MESNPLLNRFLQAFPSQFLLRLAERQKALYQQSLALSFNESWSRTEGFSVLPANRRALWESEARKTAVECGLKTFDLAHAGDNCSFVIVKADSLLLTVHYVDGPNQLVREAESRKQHAGVNRWLGYYADERLLTAPIPKLDSKPIYLYLLHGARFPSTVNENLLIDETTCFLRVAIPANDTSKYLFNWSVQELLQSYSLAGENRNMSALVEDKAQPRKKSVVSGSTKTAAGKVG